MIYFHSINTKNSNEKSISSYFDSLPIHIQKHIERYKHQKDRNNSTLGMYLIEYFIKKNLLTCTLSDLVVEKNKKPYFKEKNNLLDFNVSHSEDFVVAVFSSDSKVGVDIEKRRCLNLTGMMGRFSAEEQRNIIHANDSEKLFFDYWTQKEAVIKAAGIGIALPLAEVNFIDNTCQLRNQNWYVHQINTYQAHSCCVASSQSIHQEDIIFEELLLALSLNELNFQKIS